MANFKQIICILGILVIVIPATLCEHTYEKHIIHVPVYIHHVHHHHVLRKGKKYRPIPRKKFRRIKPKIPPLKYIRHYHSAHTTYY